MSSFDEIFGQLEKMKVAIIGDVMLDTYWWGHVERISPEAPVPVVAFRKKEQRLGGAGNVALNIAAFGSRPTLFSVIGDDDDAIILDSLLLQNNIESKCLVKSTKRLTTNKTRIMSRNQQMLRLDSEQTEDILPEDEASLVNNFETFVKNHHPDIVIFQDYNKGVLTEMVIEAIIKICKNLNIPTAIDPKRKNFFSYKGADIFKPNLKEVKDALNLLAEEINEKILSNIHAELMNALHHEISFITLSEKGVFYQEGQQGHIIPSHIRNISDVSGAGDTVIAVASLIYASTKNFKLAAEIANIAGGLVCEEVGTVAINKQRLMDECKQLINIETVL
ncbi:MAG: carbohydrate kinase [Chitinophagaceae bacterium]|nr:carbohydrate kinase [Chitinophagaceae bacterium]